MAKDGLWKFFSRTKKPARIGVGPVRLGNPYDRPPGEYELAAEKNAMRSRPYMKAPPQSWNRILVRPMKHREDVRSRRERRARPWASLTPREQELVKTPPTGAAPWLARDLRQIAIDRRERRRLTLRNKRRVTKGLQPLSMESIRIERARQAAARN